MDHYIIHSYTLCSYIRTHVHRYVYAVPTILLYNVNHSWWKTFVVACSTCNSSETFADSLVCAIHKEVQHSNSIFICRMYCDTIMLAAEILMEELKTSSYG